MITRAFIAIDPPPEVVKEIARLHPLVQNKKFTGKLTELENLHLTLKFLGEISEETLKKTEELLTQIKFNAFETKLQNAGTFVSHKKPKIVWIKIAGKEIFQLQKQIDISLSTLFPPENRFMSHMTIARVRYVEDKQDFITYINNLTLKPIRFRVTSFKLKSSIPQPLGPHYTVLKEYPADTAQFF